ncbi:MAG: protein phosphatase 2C domain-containing protein [Patescibacteria group bacterium]
MRVEYVLDKGSGEMNEDSLLISKSIFGVFDGLTSLTKYKDNRGVSGGLVASRLVKEEFEKHPSLPLENIVKISLQKLEKIMVDRNIDLTKKEERLSTTLAVVRTSNDLLEYIQVGDSPIIIINKDGTHEVIMSSNNSDKKALLLWMKFTHEEGIREWGKDKRMMDQLLMDRHGANVRFGTLNGEKEVLGFIKTGTKKISEIKQILITTDGLFLPQENPSEGEKIEELIDLYQKMGLKKLKDYVREVETKDTQFKYPRFKLHDDMAAISLTFDTI